MQANEFIEYCRSEINKIYQNSIEGKPDDKHKHRTEGLLQALRHLDILTQAQIGQMVEDEHQAVFGVSVAERKAQKALLAALKNTDPDKYYEIPAIERMAGRAQ